MTEQANPIDQIHRLNADFDFLCSELEHNCELIDMDDINDEQIIGHLLETVVKVSRSLQLLRQSVAHMREATNIALDWKVDAVEAKEAV